MKNNIKLFLVGIVLLSACGNNSTLEEMKSQKQKASQAQQEYTNTMINYTQSVYNLLIAKLEVNKALGSL